jgi:hypothetical protein
MAVGKKLAKYYRERRKQEEARAQARALTATPTVYRAVAESKYSLPSLEKRASLLEKQAWSDLQAVLLSLRYCKDNNRKKALKAEAIRLKGLFSQRAQARWESELRSELEAIWKD